MGHVDGVHIVVVEAEDLRSLESHDISWESLLLGGEVSALDVERVLASVGEHVFDFEVPSDGRDVSLLEEELLGLDVVHEEALEVIDDGHLLPVG